MSSSADVARRAGGVPAAPPPAAPPPAGRRRGGSTGGQGLAGWLFVTPVLVVLGLFLVLPIFMALWVSLTDWRGQGSPFSSGVGFVGADNYARLLTEPGLAREDFFTSLRNNAYYVVIVVPLQTALALFLAVVLNQKVLRGRGFFRTAFYFPSVTSSVAVSLVFLFLFTGTGAVNGLLGLFGIDGPTWFADPRGLLHLAGDALGLWELTAPPAALTGASFAGLSAWEWLSGPSVALTAIVFLVVWTTAGTFMLMFIAALQDIPVEVEEAAMIDGTGRWQRFRYVILPMLRPTLFLVLTLGLIGTWQVFDQVYVMSQGAPAKTTLTPAYLSYQYSFNQSEWGVGAAMAFLLFGIILALTSAQRFLLRDKDAARERSLQRAAARRARAAARSEQRASS